MNESSCMFGARDMSSPKTRSTRLHSVFHASCLSVAGCECFFYRTIRSFCHPILCVLLVPLVLVLRHLKYSAHSMSNINQISVVSLTNCRRNNKNDETSKTSFGEIFFFFNPRGFVPITPLFSFMAC